MAARNVLVVISEIEKAIDGIELAMKGKTLEEFSSDWLLKRGVERGLEIISEACRHVPDELLGQEPDIRWKQIRGIGNVLRHNYHNVSDVIVWTAVKDEIPPLRDAIKRIRMRLAGR